METCCFRGETLSVMAFTSLDYTFQKRAIGVDAAVSQEVKELPELSDASEIEVRDQHFLLGPGPSQNLSERIGDEALAVERHLVLDSDPVHGGDEDAVGDGVRADDRPPGLGGAVPGPVRLGADGRRVEEYLGAFKREDPRYFGKPLVPANPDSDDPVAGGKDRIAEVSRGEVELLVILRSVGNVGLAVLPELAAIGVEDDGGIEIDPGPRLFEDGDDEDDSELRRERRHALGGFRGQRFGERIAAHIYTLRKVAGLEELLEADNCGALRSRLTNSLLRPSQVERRVVSGRELEKRDSSHGRYPKPNDATTIPRGYQEFSSGETGLQILFEPV